MALRASNAVPARAYEEIKGVALQLQRQAQSRASSWASGGSASEVLAVLDNAVANKARLQTLAAVPGVAAYAQAQENDPGYDIIAEYNALISAIDGVINEIVTTMPTSNPGGFVEAFTLAADGSVTYRTFTAGQLSGVITALNAVVAAVA